MNTNEEDIIIYGLLITIAYFSVASVAMSRFKKTLHPVNA